MQLAFSSNQIAFPVSFIAIDIKNINRRREGTVFISIIKRDYNKSFLRSNLYKK